MYAQSSCVCLDTGLYRRLPLKWMKLQCEVRGEALPARRGFKVRGDTFIHYRQTDGRQEVKLWTLTCWRTHAPHIHTHTYTHLSWLFSLTHTRLALLFMHKRCERWWKVSQGVLTHSLLAPFDLTALKTLQHVEICTDFCFAMPTSRSLHAFQRRWRWGRYADLHKDADTAAERIQQFEVFIFRWMNECSVSQRTNEIGWY